MNIIIIFELWKYELDRKKIIAVINTTSAVVKRKPEKNQACTQKKSGPYRPDFFYFSGFLFTTAEVVFITAMIFFLSNSYFRSSNI